MVRPGVGVVGSADVTRSEVQTGLNYVPSAAAPGRAIATWLDRDRGAARAADQGAVGT